MPIWAETGSSVLSAIMPARARLWTVYRGHGTYSLLDSRRGRIFTYDHEGNLLYIFGGIGSQAGTFLTPTAIEQLGSRLLVLDSQQGNLTVFAQTEYGSLINRAVALRFDGDETQAVPLWQEVLRLDEINELANTGIGKAYLSAGITKTRCCTCGGA